jgi:hypothetical protein
VRRESIKMRDISFGDCVCPNMNRPNARFVEHANPAPAALRKKLRRLLDMNSDLREMCWPQLKKIVRAVAKGNRKS